MNTGSIIYLEDVTVNYDGFQALSHLNFFMDRRELRVVIGPNGAGKTTLLDVEERGLAGAVRADHHAQLAAIHEEVQMAQRLEAIVVHGHVLEIDDAAGVHLSELGGRLATWVA